MAFNDFFYQEPKKNTKKTTSKVKTVKGTNGNDNLTSKAANENIYLYAGEDTLDFKATHGTDTVYIGTGTKNLKFTNNLEDIKVKRSGNNVVIKTKNAKNQTETVTVKNYLRSATDVTITGADESKNLLDYFEGQTFTRGNSKSKTAQTIKGSRLDNEIFAGGKGNDTISVYGGKGNVITGGKGKDTIDLGNSSENIIKIKKGDGNDKIIFNNNVDSDCVATICTKDVDSAFYYKKGKDLVIKFIHNKLKSEAKAVSEKVTIKNAFDSAGNLSDKLYISFDNGETEDRIMDVMYLSLETNEYENNVIEGTKYNDRIYCGSKGNDITDLTGNNVIVTGYKGSSNIMTGDGDDFIYVSSLNTITTINDIGGKNEVVIETNDFGDAFTFFDVASNKYIGEINDKIAIVNGKNLDSLNINDLTNNKLKGVTIKGNNESFSVALMNSKQQVSKTLEGSELTSFFVRQEVKSFLDNYGTNGYDKTAYEFLNDNNVSQEDKKKLLAIYKLVSDYNEKGLVIKEDNINNHEEKQVTMAANGIVTLEGKFQDTKIINYPKVGDKTYNEICDNKIVINDYSLTDNSIKFSYNLAHFSGHQLDTDIMYTLQDGEIVLCAFDKDKNKYTDYHKLTLIDKTSGLNNKYYWGGYTMPIGHPEQIRKIADMPIGIYNFSSERLYLQDKDRLYRIENYFSNHEVNLVEPSSDIPELTIKYTEINDINYVENRDSANHIAYFAGQSNYIRLAETYNFIDVYSEENSSITYSGGWAKINSTSTKSNDSYNVWNFDKNSSIIISDAGSTAVPETEEQYGTGDDMYIGTEINKLRLFFNVTRSGAEARPNTVPTGSGSTYTTQSYDTDDLFIVYDGNLNTNNIKFEKNFENSSLYSSRTENPISNSNLGFYNADITINNGITIENMFSDGKIEEFTSNTKFNVNEDSTTYLFDMDHWVDEVRAHVAGWFDSHTGYIDTADVLENGSKSDIISLLARYNDISYADTIGG